MRNSHIDRFGQPNLEVSQMSDAIVTVEKVARRVYLVNLPFARKEAAKEQLGAKWDVERKQWYVSSAKESDAREFARKVNSGELAADKPDANKIRVVGKVEYKGKTYYASSLAGSRFQLHSMPGADGTFISFSAEANVCKIVKRYEPRTVRASRFTVREEYQTLAGLHRFVEQQKADRIAGVPQCAQCGKHSDSLIEDNEDGLMKCRACCDMPSE